MMMPAMRTTTASSAGTDGWLLPMSSGWNRKKKRRVGDKIGHKRPTRTALSTGGCAESKFLCAAFYL